MTSKLSTQVTGFLFVTFALWYILRRTSLGSAYFNDMWSIPDHLGVSGGLRSAQEYLGAQM